jgi:hypothetical protein
VDNIKEDALKDIRSKLSASNIVQEIFTPFAGRCASTIGLIRLHFSRLNPQSHRDYGHGNAVPARNLYWEGPQVTGRPHPEDGIWGSAALLHDTEFGI